MSKRIGIFGWGVVAPKSPDIGTFERNLSSATSWLEPFDGFGPSNFLVGRPEFDFESYKPWIDARFDPRRFSVLQSKMGNTVKYAIGAFIQALNQNPGIEPLLKDLGPQTHCYVGTGLGDFPLQYELSLRYYRAQRKWNRFWCQDEHHSELKEYRLAGIEEKKKLCEQLGAPQDPAQVDPWSEAHDEISDQWYEFWVAHSDGLRRYLDTQRESEGVGITGDIEHGKQNIIRRKMTTRRKLNEEYGCPTEPWNAVDPNLLWNIPNIPAAQISMLAHITGPAVAPLAACSGFSVALKMGIDAIRSEQAKVAVIGMTDPEPHALSVGTFYGARVLSHDGQVSKPFTGFRGTHVAGGACIWIVGDADYLKERGFNPLGLEVLSVAVSSDADHIITPSEEGPRRAVQQALAEAEVNPNDVATWDMHATATPGDWSELQGILAEIPGSTAFTARKGSFGHGMSVCGGWELTAQHLGFSKGELHPVNLSNDEIHDQIRALDSSLVQDKARPTDGDVAGKINMGVGGINACVICRRW
ncbi:MAG: beta-ketoacyl synthase [bacterium]|nr:beta-ketoacyl synthase [bacterium]